MLNVTISSNGDYTYLPYGTNTKELRLADYQFYTNDLIINANNNTIMVKGTTFTLQQGNYSSNPAVFAAYLTTVLAGKAITVTYDATNTNLFTFTGVFTVMDPFTLSIPSNAKGLYGLSSTSYTVATGTTFTSEFPVHFTNSDYYYINISPATSYEQRVPSNLDYTYKVVNTVKPLDLLYHTIQEPLAWCSCNNPGLTQIRITVRDQWGNMVPMNGTTWSFFILLKC